MSTKATPKPRLWIVNAEGAALDRLWKARPVGDDDADLFGTYASAQERGALFVVAPDEATAVRSARGLQKARRLLDHVRAEEIGSHADVYRAGYKSALYDVQTFVKSEADTIEGSAPTATGDRVRDGMHLAIEAVSSFLARAIAQLGGGK